MRVSAPANLPMRNRLAPEPKLVMVVVPVIETPTVATELRSHVEAEARDVKGPNDELASPDAVIEVAEATRGVPSARWYAMIRQ